MMRKDPIPKKFERKRLQQMSTTMQQIIEWRNALSALGSYTIAIPYFNKALNSNNVLAIIGKGYALDYSVDLTKENENKKKKNNQQQNWLVISTIFTLQSCVM